MALTQFNQWEPTLDPVNGVMAQEPRLFAHDAVAVSYTHLTLPTTTPV